MKTKLFGALAAAALTATPAHAKIEEVRLGAVGNIRSDHGDIVEGKEEALMSQFASFRAEPLKYVHATEPSRTLPKADTTCAGSFAKSPYTSPARDGAPTTKSSANPSSTPASLSA